MPAPGTACVYLLACGAAGSLYCGWTSDLAARVTAHRSGRGAKYTRSRQPVRLVWHAECENATAARRLEPRIKRLTRKDKLALVAGRLDLEAI